MKKLQLPRIFNVLDMVAVLFLIVSFVNIILHWSSLPEQVPSHYNFWGEVDLSLIHI